jgi:hypothetical protein
MHDTHESTNEKDRWFLSCEDHVELEETIKLNIEKYKDFGYKITEYDYQMISLTDNHHEIMIK